MVLSAICYKGTIGLEGAVGTMDVEYYTVILEDDLLVAENEILNDIWTLKHDNAPIHMAAHTNL